MENTTRFIPVPGLAEAVRLFTQDRTCPYRLQAEEVCGALCHSVLWGSGSVAVELTDDASLPPALRGKQIPAITAVRVTPMRDHRFTERAVTVYTAPDDIKTEAKRRGASFRCCLMSVREFLDYVGGHELSARFVSGRARFNLLWLQLNDVRERAARFFEEEAERQKKEQPALEAARKEEAERQTELRESGMTNRFFRPLFGVVAAVNAELPDDRRAFYAVCSLVRHSLFPDGHLLVERDVRDERGGPKTERVAAGGVEREALIVYTSDEVPYREITENNRIVLYSAYDAFAFLKLAHRMKVSAKLITTKREVIVPYPLLEHGWQAA